MPEDIEIKIRQLFRSRHTVFMDDLADLGLDLISILHFHDEILKLAAYYKTTIYIHRPKIQDDNL